MKVKKKLSLALIFLFLGGCSLSKTSPTELPLTRDEIWTKIVRGERKVGLWRIEALMHMEKGHRRYPPLKLLFFLHPPSSLRIEALSVLGPPDFFLTVEGKKLKVCLPEKNECYLGTPEAKNLAPFLPFAISPEKLVSLLMGIPYLPATDFRGREIKEEGETRLSILTEDGLFLNFTFDGQGILKTEEVINTETGNTLLSVAYLNYYHREDKPFPRKLLLKDEDTAILLDYTEVEYLKEPPHPDLFDLSIPRLSTAEG